MKTLFVYDYLVKSTQNPFAPTLRRISMTLPLCYQFSAFTTNHSFTAITISWDFQLALKPGVIITYSI